MISDVIIPIVYPLYIITPQNARRFHKVLLMTSNRIINSSKFEYAFLIYLLIVIDAKTPVELISLLAIHLGARCMRISLVARLSH